MDPETPEHDKGYNLNPIQDMLVSSPVRGRQQTGMWKRRKLAQAFELYGDGKANLIIDEEKRL